MKSTRPLHSSRNRMLETERRLPLNTIVLPPLPAENEFQLLHKVLVNKPKSGSVNGEIVAVGRTAEVNTRSTDIPKGNESARVAQLEQNIRFLQEQHSQMLAGLHKEIDNLRHRNRELQFQLVFTKGGIPSSPSSPEDDTKPKIYPSPKQVNCTPLQVEILEKELGELKSQLQEIDDRNAYLSAIVEEQKKKLERYERDREREIERATQPDPELLRKLDDAEALIRRLRRENSELRHENSVGSSSSPNSGGGSYHQREGQRSGSTQNRSNNGRHRGNSAGHYRGNWFPPLHAQTYWHGGRGVERNGGNGGDNTTLPSLLPNGSSNSNGQYQGRRGANNNHYHNNGEGRKYRSGQNRGPKPS
ncbi:hypothetical protein ILUMI_26731 [Ignelater luminosus]|uniref:CCDC92/74 N-terminal domain-containing protein n=1 Tax=Ignelater luminosus TaxID=2038154 RepID=A0A8K0FYE0_IGNLU|nr:hypothetical protein ILUMI_26731 [Ignelater luminosus]